MLFLQFRCDHGVKIEFDIILVVSNPGEERPGLDEEALAHFEHRLEFMTTCLIVNEPSHFCRFLS